MKLSVFFVRKGVQFFCLVSTTTAGPTTTATTISEATTTSEVTTIEPEESSCEKVFASPREEIEYALTPAESDDDDESDTICTEDMSDVTTFAELTFADSVATGVEEIVISGLTNVDESTLSIVYEDANGDKRVLQLTVLSSILEESPVGTSEVLYVTVEQDSSPLTDESLVNWFRIDFCLMYCTFF